jgi:hypothetical protein
MFHARWDREVKALVSRGMDRFQAIRAVDHSHPGLREQMIAEVNEQRGRPVPTADFKSEVDSWYKTPASPAANAKAFHSASDQWNSIVSDLVSKGMSLSQARSQAARDNPTLREAMVEDANNQQSSRGNYGRSRNHYRT